MSQFLEAQGGMGSLGTGRSRKARSSWMYRELQRVGKEEAGETWGWGGRHQPWEGFILWARRGSQGFIWSRGMAASTWSSRGKFGGFVKSGWGLRRVIRWYSACHPTAGCWEITWQSESLCGRDECHCSWDIPDFLRCKKTMAGRWLVDELGRREGRRVGRGQGRTWCQTVFKIPSLHHTSS